MRLSCETFVLILPSHLISGKYVCVSMLELQSECVVAGASQAGLGGIVYALRDFPYNIQRASPGNGRASSGSNSTFWAVRLSRLDTPLRIVDSDSS